MLSKAEILYLQGQKQVSQSYERKLKCLIKKKLEVLQKELPLLSKLLSNEVSSFADISNTTELAAPIAKDKRSFNQPNQPLRLNNRATKFSNLESNGIEIDTRKIVKSQNFDEFALSVKANASPATEFSNAESNGIEIGARRIVKSQNSEGFTHLVMDNSTPATEFSNEECDGATKYSNSHDMHNIRSKPTNPSTNKPITHENPNKSSKNDLISIWAGSDLYCQRYNF